MPVSLKKIKSLIILLSLIFVQLVLISIQVPVDDESNYLEKIVFSVFSPIGNGVVSVFHGIGNVWNNYFGLHDAQNDNQRLQEEVFRLNQENNILRNILRTYRTEKDMMNLLVQFEGSILPARIVGLDASNVWKSLVINKGSLDGVKKDMVVLDKKGYLVGRVVEPVSFKQSRVQMITDSQSGVHVTPPEKNIPGIISGDKDGLCKLEFVLATETSIVEGDRLITSGWDGIYIPGVLVGYVISVEENISSLFKDIKVAPAFKLQDLDLVAIIKKDIHEFY
jgi:rod shape-determining protein MreC